MQITETSEKITYRMVLDHSGLQTLKDFIWMVIYVIDMWSKSDYSIRKEFMEIGMDRNRN